MRIRKRTIALFLALTVISFGLGQGLRVAGAGGAPGDPGVNLRKTIVVDVAEKTKSAVVYISTTKTITQRVNPFGDPFFMPFTQTQRVGSLGSGFIIHKDGYVVTNNHVIEGAREIKIEMLDGQKFAADIVSADSDADLAILKITSKDPLPALELGDSTDLMIGEPVIAVGNPLGFSHTVSTGIVSALHRDLTGPGGVKKIEDVIQTDAAINPGNSGGPLLNAYGQVIGISTAIRSDAQNIGFAIQVNRLRDLIPALMSPAHVNKTEIPIRLTESRKMIQPATVEATIHVDDSNETVKSIAGQVPRDIVDAYAIILRFGAPKSFELVTDKGKHQIQGKEVATADVIVQAKKKLGLTVEQMTPLLAGRLEIDQEAGVLITDVEEGSIGGKAGLQKDDVIVQIDRYRVLTLDHLSTLLELMPTKGKVRVAVVRPKEQFLGRTVLNFGS